jgi:hypothetical protein
MLMLRWLCTPGWVLTHGAEQRYLAFVWDPFDFTASGGAFGVTAAAVLEHASRMLSAVGVMWIAANRRRAR